MNIKRIHVVSCQTQDHLWIMPKKAAKKPEEPKPILPPPLMPGFGQSKAGYKQMLDHMRKWRGKHPQFMYKMSDFHPRHTVTLLDEEGKLVGFFGLWPSVQEASQFNEKHTYLTIDVVEVMEEHRGKGAGRRLLDQIVAIGRQGGYKSIRTFAVAGAFEFYLHYGFVKDLRAKDKNVRFDL